MTTIVRQDSRIAIIFVFIGFPTCHVFKLYSVDPFPFEVGKTTNMEWKFNEDQKVQHKRTERKRYVIFFIMFYLIMFS